MAEADETKQMLLKQQSIMLAIRDCNQALLSASTRILECYMEGSINNPEAQNALRRINNLRDRLMQPDTEAERARALTFIAIDERNKIIAIHDAFRQSETRRLHK